MGTSRFISILTRIVPQSYPAHYQPILCNLGYTVKKSFSLTASVRSLYLQWLGTREYFRCILLGERLLNFTTFFYLRPPPDLKCPRDSLMAQMGRLSHHHPFMGCLLILAFSAILKTTSLCILYLSQTSWNLFSTAVSSGILLVLLVCKCFVFVTLSLLHFILINYVSMKTNTCNQLTVLDCKV